MTSTRPYLLKAFYEWILDNHFTPYLVVTANLPGVDVPRQYVEEDGRIVLNIAPDAVRDLQIETAYVSFSAKFGGQAHNVYAPVRSITAVYAKENGRGMVFKEDDLDDELPPEDESSSGATGKGSSGAAGKGSKIGSKKGGKGRPNLTVVK